MFLLFLLFLCFLKDGKRGFLGFAGFFSLAGFAAFFPFPFPLPFFAAFAVGVGWAEEEWCAEVGWAEVWLTEDALAEGVAVGVAFAFAFFARATRSSNMRLLKTRQPDAQNQGGCAVATLTHRFHHAYQSRQYPDQ